MNEQEKKDKWVAVGDLVADILGFADKPTADIITRHAKEHTGSKKGHGSIPKRYFRSVTKLDNPKQRFEYLLSAESRIFFKNLLDLESILPSRIVASILRREHLSDQKKLRRALGASKRAMEAKQGAYEKWIAHFPSPELLT